MQPSVSFNGKEYEFAKLIGRGSFGDVYLAKENLSGNQYAVKVIEKNKMNDPQQAVYELQSCTSLEHQNICKVYGVTESTDHIYVLMEYISTGNITDYFKSKYEISEEIVKTIFRQVVNGISALHSEKIAHRDLKPSNILLSSNGTVKLTGFGLAKAVKFDLFLESLDSHHSLTDVPMGHDGYGAPEIRQRYNNNTYDAFKADIYSLGILFRELVRHSESRMTPECHDLFDKLTNKDHSLRPSAAAIFKDAWFA